MRLQKNIRFFCELSEKELIFAVEKELNMEIIFNEEYLREMYNTGRTDKKHRFQPQIIRKYIRVIDLMRDTSNVLGLMRYNALNYEKLKDDKAGLSSVRVNDQYRIEFEEHTKDGETVATICNITDLSNHYK
ncbi:MAG: RelE-like toxin of type II toxin-antitoxin system HigB [Bacteriophage sp.]|uniref:Plasmid maintenance system killer protein n=7 Tax=root TaxID=1 RepID=B3JGZ3_9BACT|nr:plasmid maintenance system killer protein [Phocaeicola coprocola DSM 17136]UVY09082.1 MAG: RelE-like toxin of type II toxin-antitoxin system HigB [Bacteriophage sp.]UVY18272.1 MAG: RelE-like toxin of type II toxin-antitoxin system HigB [Bacteriophage sp.]UVY24792.1 MAG: RelE-like toxin of type II toxin-antitoxin system HigB [Bacteriophage sp.]UVY39525.1 MAG: RelE-like toxin of type II toxin-antitoxin system HigB [Bacteriophage sp.]